MKLFIQNRIDDIKYKFRLEYSLFIEKLIKRNVLKSICKQVELKLLNEINKYLLTDLNTIAVFEKQEIQNIGNSGFVFQNETYVLQLEISPKKLNVTIQNTNSTESRLNRLKSIRIEGFGKFEKLGIRIEQKLTKLLEPILLLTKARFETAYKALVEFVENDLSKFQDVIAQELYDELRKEMKPEIVNQIWLYIVIEDMGFYITDKGARQKLLYNAKSSDIVSGRSPIEILSTFTTKLLNYDIIMSKEAVTNDRTLIGKFANVKYFDTDFPFVEEAGYGSKELVVIPIVIEGVFVIAGTPAIYCSYLTDRLRAKRNIFSRIILHHFSRLRLFKNEIYGRDNSEISIIKRMSKYFDASISFNFGIFQIQLNSASRETTRV